MDRERKRDRGVEVGIKKMQCGGGMGVGGRDRGEERDRQP